VSFVSIIGSIRGRQKHKFNELLVESMMAVVASRYGRQFLPNVFNDGLDQGRPGNSQ
jgi:hypothetical protein